MYVEFSYLRERRRANARSQDLLSERGQFYLVAVEQNKPLEIIKRMQARGFVGEVRPPLFSLANPILTALFHNRLSSNAEQESSTFPSSASPDQRPKLPSSSDLLPFSALQSSSYLFPPSEPPSHRRRTTSPLLRASSCQCEFQSRTDSTYPFSRRRSPIVESSFGVMESREGEGHEGRESRASKRTMCDGQACVHPRSFRSFVEEGAEEEGESTKGDGGKEGSTMGGKRVRRYAAGSS